ncbi:SepM family pheromone-processing serine protease [Bacillaceae bacterium S4-13-56]
MSNKRYMAVLIIVFLISLFVGSYRLPYYVYKPGSADALDPMVTVQDAFNSEGDMHLVTVRGGQATPLQLLLAYIQPFYDIYPIEEIRPEGVTEQEYMNGQLHMMETSQEASIVVAYEAANKEISIEYMGVYVMSILDGMPAGEFLEIGDRIIQVDDIKVEKSDDLIDYVSTFREGESVAISFTRSGETKLVNIPLAEFPENPEKVGIGISLVTDREIVVDPEVEFKSGDIGGPSAGLMFSLEIYDQLTEEDITKGYQIAGTGEINYNGEVGRIGGIDKKVVAADSEGVDVFFAPYEGGAKDSNYEVAKKAAEKIGTDMKIVPVDTFQEALSYLQNLDPK